MAKTARKTKARVPRSRAKAKPTKTSRRTTKKTSSPAGKSIWQETKATGLVILGIFLLVAISSELSRDVSISGKVLGQNTMGLLGQNVSQLLLSVFGWCSFVSALWCFALAVSTWSNDGESESRHFFGVLNLTATVLLLVSSASIFAVFFGHEGGGWLGSKVAFKEMQLLNRTGAVLLSSAVFFIALGIATGLRTSMFVGLLSKAGAYASEYLLDAMFVIKESVLNLCHLIKFLLLGIFRVVAASLFYAWSAVLGLLSGANRKLAEASERAQESDGAFTELAETISEQAKVTRTSDGFVLGTESENEIEAPPTSRVKRSTSPEPVSSSIEEEPISETQSVEPRILRNLQTGDESAESVKEKPAYRRKSNSETKKKSGGLLRPSNAVTYENYEIPSLDILVPGDKSNSNAPDDKELIQNSKSLETALENFKIGGRVSEVHPGPVVTLYQFEPAAGVKVQKIINLADDLALALRVASVRVFAPVPGKGTVGIEVPNAQREMVRLRDVLEGEDYQQSDVPLLLGLGKDTYGDPYVGDLAKMPHLLIAGATGTGKSVCINSILLSLLCRNSPESLRLLLIDPKMLELSMYEDIPHLNAPVVTQPKKARGVLWWAVEEMERRYELMKDLGVRNVAMYNRAVVSGNMSGTRFGRKKQTGVIVLEETDVIATASPLEGLDRSLDADMEAAEAQAMKDAEPLPRIVIVVDELADLMLTVGREIEELLTRLAQKARASGIHLILATQRPSVNVITGLIKANFPARISFKVASKIDARTVMDTSGAERLLGQGDMLFMSPAAGRIMRLHSPFVSDKEVHDLVEEIRVQGAPSYDDTIEKMIAKMEESESSGTSSGVEDDEYDEHYDKAVALVVEKGQASTSMVQRAFRIGYNRAARILDTMERDGVVGPADGSRPRQVLVGSIE